MLKNEKRFLIYKKTPFYGVFFSIFLLAKAWVFVNLQILYSTQDIASTGQAAIASSTSRFS